MHKTWKEEGVGSHAYGWVARLTRCEFPALEAVAFSFQDRTALRCGLLLLSSSGFRLAPAVNPEAVS